MSGSSAHRKSKRGKGTPSSPGSSHDLAPHEDARISLSPSVVMAVMSWHQKRA